MLAQILNVPDSLDRLRLTPFAWWSLLAVLYLVEWQHPVATLAVLYLVQWYRIT
ncbi:MAG TPA: hypothetical protein VE135_22650 [Pyrinomonadaceae bacterium]|nr:hypothetical protein [Pyrinomonadaceae bacterium]